MYAQSVPGTMRGGACMRRVYLRVYPRCI